MRETIARRLAGDAAAIGDADEGLTPCAVLVPLVDWPTGMTVLLTRRADHLADHAGQISFPGGRVEPGDHDPVAAALREAAEEVGLAAARVEIVGRLATYRTGTGFSITPVVGLVRPPLELSLDAAEVAAVFEVPLDFVLDPGNHRRDSMIWRGEQHWYDVLAYGEHYIWGATAGMLVNLARRLAG